MLSTDRQSESEMVELCFPMYRSTTSTKDGPNSNVCRDARKRSRCRIRLFDHIPIASRPARHHPLFLALLKSEPHLSQHSTVR